MAAGGGMFPVRSGLRRSADGGRWRHPDNSTPHERMIQWHGSRPSPRFIDGFCHLGEFRQMANIASVDGLKSFGASRVHWPQTMINNYAAATYGLASFPEMAVSCLTLKFVMVLVLLCYWPCFSDEQRLRDCGIPVGPV
jgi:hypothetical protein